MNPERIDIPEELYEEYATGIEEHAEKAKTASSVLFKSIKFYNILFYIYGALVAIKILFEIVVYLSPDSYYDPRDSFFELHPEDAIFISVIIGYANICLLVYVLAKEDIDKLDTLIKKQVIKPLAEGKANELKQHTFELAQSMGIDTGRICFWTIINNALFPSIEDDGENIHIIFPLSFIMYAKKNPDRAKAVIAHEFGHVLQKDTKLFLVVDSYFTVIRFIMVPSAIISLVIKLVIGVRFSNEIMTAQGLNAETYFFMFLLMLAPEVLVLRYLFAGFEKLRALRQRSEILADTAAVIYARGEELSILLEELGSNRKRATSIHPDKNERIQNIHTLLKRSAYVEQKSLV